MDGLQNGHFNYRAAFLTKEGKLIVGGQDGINIIDTQMERKPQKHVKALFSGLVLFDHPLAAGEEYEGRVVLTRLWMSAENSISVTRKMPLPSNWLLQT